MKAIRLKVLALMAVAGMTVALAGAAPATAATSGTAATCTGGSIASGTYSSLDIAGPCNLDSGPVTVEGDLTVQSTGDLFAAYGGSDLTVDGNLFVERKGVLVLGCEVEAFTCFNDDPNNQTMYTYHSIGGNLTAHGALAVLVHHNTIGAKVVLQRGGGGINCDPQSRLLGSPAYATYEDNTIGGNVSITGWQSCWLGFFRNTTGNVTFLRNATLDPDGNEIATNTISGGLRCSGNSPAPQFGDSGGSPNVVSGPVTGQCVGLTT